MIKISNNKTTITISAESSTPVIETQTPVNSKESVTVFNETGMTSKYGPMIIGDSSGLDNRVNVIHKMLTPAELKLQGSIDAFAIAAAKANNMTDSGCDTAYYDIISKIQNNKEILNSATEEFYQITDIYQKSGFIKPNKTVPEYYKFSFLGNDKNKLPLYIGLTRYMPFELDLKKLFQIENLKEEQIKDHFQKVKAYWDMIESTSNPENLMNIAKTITEEEDDFYSKVKDYSSYMAGKTLTSLYSCNALCVLNKGCKNIKYCQDPYIAFCILIELMRIKDNAPNWSMGFKLTSWESSKDFNQTTAVYSVAPTIYYKVIPPRFLGKCSFERNGKTY